MRLLGLLATCLILAGCGTQYSLLYNTKVAADFRSENTDPFTFYIDPVPNGIIFTVRNNSDQTAKIIWDKSYFIMPDGNSYKALNTDILKEEQEIVVKAQYVSVIPSRATFSRFTTASVNASKFKFEEAAVFSSTWQNYTTTNIKYLEAEFLSYGNYWPLTVNVDVSDVMPKENDEIKIRNALNSISNEVARNNNLGFGLVIEHRGTEKEYRFDIKITKIHAVKKVNVAKDGESAKTKYILDYTFDVPSNKWQKVGAELKN